MDVRTLGCEVARLRKEKGLGLRELGRKAELSAASLSAIEKGESSPTLATFHRILTALEMDFVDFFSSGKEQNTSPVTRAKDMHIVKDAIHKCVFLLARRPNIRFEMFRETIMPSETGREWEAYDFDVGGVVLSGGPMRLDVEGEGSWPVNKGDSFYVKRGLRHRVVNTGKRPLELVTTVTPPRY